MQKTKKTTNLRHRSLQSLPWLRVLHGSSGNDAPVTAYLAKYVLHCFLDSHRRLRRSLLC